MLAFAARHAKALRPSVAAFRAAGESSARGPFCATSVGKFERPAQGRRGLATASVKRTLSRSASKYLQQELHSDMKLMLSSIGGSREVQYWLSHYGNNDGRPEIAVIKVGGAVLQNEDLLQSLVNSVSFLKRAGLAPVIIHGAGPQLIQALAEQDIVSDYVEGLRVTTPEILKTARRVFLDANRKLVKALHDTGTDAAPIDASIFEADMLDQENLGYVGKIVKVHGAWIHEAVADGAVPVVPPLGESTLGQTLNINADVAAVELAIAVQPQKVIYINDMGGLLNEQDKLMPNINYPSDYEWLLKQPWLRHGTKLKVKEIGHLLDHLPMTSSVSVTSPESLMKELFTHSGQGTLCRKETTILKYDSLTDPGIDFERVKDMLRNAFGKEPTDEYMDRVTERADKVYLCETYSGMVILSKEDGTSVPYMDKFVVSKLAQGIGTGKALWLEVVADNPSLFWRSRQSNAVNKWYYQVSHGSFRCPGKQDWVTFYRGLDPRSADDAKNIQACIDVAVSLNSSFVEEGDEEAATSPPKSLSAAVAPSGTARPRSSSFSTAAGANPAPVRVGLLGARGYVGMELLRLVASHPTYELAAASSRSLKGQNVGEVTARQAREQNLQVSEDGVAQLRRLDFTDMSPEDCAKADVDLWFLALPNGLAVPFVDSIAAVGGKKMIDLSADYRLDSSWVYGLPEMNRENIHGATCISNPGCYATGAQLAILPLLKKLKPGQAPNVFGVSGYSGAGTTPSPKNDTSLLNNNLMPYSLSGHIHEREVSRHLQHNVHFMPHVASFFRGIHLTVQMTLDEGNGLTVDELRETYTDYYANEPLVQVLDDPQVAHNAGQHHAAVGNFTVGGGNNSNTHVVVTATIDNLLKGAATQAIQNANLSCGLDEFCGIEP
eukprot:g8095.t1